MPLKVPASLVRHLNEKRCVIFVGAGLSAQAKLPSWGKLLDDLVTQVGADESDEESTAELKKLLEAGRYLDVADECKERLGSGYAEFLSKVLQVGSGPVPEAHRLVMQLPFAAWITTNYDKLLEQAHFQVRGSVPKTLTHLDADTFGTLLFDGAPFILKAHGDVDKPESLIFTTRDYREMIHSNPAFQAVFSAILLTRAVLFVGYSLNDPDFRLLLDRQLTMFKKFVPERYAVMAGVGDVEREVLRRTAQIKVIPYPAGQHEQLVEFLRALQAQVSGTTAAPPRGVPEEQERERDDAPGMRAPSRGGMPLGGGGMSGPALDLGDLLSAPPPQSRPAAAAPPAAAPLPPRPKHQANAVDAVPPSPSAKPPPVPAAEHRAPFDFPARAQRRSVEPEADEVVLEQTQTTAHGSASSSSAPAGVVEAGRPGGTVVLALSARGQHTVAALKDAAGETIAQGTGPASTGSSLARLQGQVKNELLVGGMLADQLPGAVRQPLEALLENGATPSIVLELDAESETKPWELLRAWGKPLALQAAVWRAPVGLSSAARGWSMFRRPVRAALIGDPTGELPGSRREIERLTQLYPDATVLMGRDATLDNVASLLNGPTKFDVVHFAGHAWYDAQEVYLVLAGGIHLTDDLIRSGLSHRPPCVLFLNSHYTAFVPPGVSAKGAEPMKATMMGRTGFTEVSMRAGVGAFIGCFGSPTDDGAEAIAVAFHQAVLAGLPVAHALHRARTQVQLPADDATPLLYSLSGYGDLTLE
ncbi:MAG TPA: SIR2 family protein [Myxococcaceae bacterium]|nr:SIR2 family protein [Myxococcaceae bacterium]